MTEPDDFRYLILCNEHGVKSDPIPQMRNLQTGRWEVIRTVEIKSHEDEEADH